MSKGGGCRVKGVGFWVQGTPVASTDPSGEKQQSVTAFSCPCKRRYYASTPRDTPDITLKISPDIIIKILHSDTSR